MKEFLFSICFIIGCSFILIPIHSQFFDIKDNQETIIKKLDSLNSHYEEIKSVQYDMVDMLGDIPCDSID